MLTIFVTMSESVDEATDQFVYQLFRLELEHSLASVSKWESKFAKPFLASGDKTSEEVGAYIECMAIDSDVPPEVFQNLSKENASEITEYINSTQTATWFSDNRPQPKSQETITAEIIYYWMTSLRIPWEAQHWHLNRLLTLIRVFDLKQTKPKKMSRNEQLERQRQLNEQRKKALGTSG